MFKATPSSSSEHISDSDDLQFYNELRECKDRYLSHHLNRALDIVSDAVRLYGPNQLFSSYNGGKDADVIMHLYRAAVAKYSADKSEVFRPQLVYFAIEDEFPDIIDHIQTVERKYNLDLTRYDCGIGQGIRLKVDEINRQIQNKYGRINMANGTDSHSNYRATPAIFLGTRKGDPNCRNQESFSPASDWMPVSFMRVNPIIDWDYGHVWHFLRLYNLPYCKLYDMGYTSLGKVALTKPNPALKRRCGSDSSNSGRDNVGLETLASDSMYWPAYMLNNWSLERAGRISKPNENIKQKKSVVRVKDTAAVKTCGLVIIGDEILNGFTSEMNVQVAAKCLQEKGVKITKVAIVQDDMDEIIEEIVRIKEKCDIIITSGGIGPTHDDVTLNSVAKALNEEMAINSEMLNFLENFSGDNSIKSNSCERDNDGIDIDMVQLKRAQDMATLPESSQLLFPPNPDNMTTFENTDPTTGDKETVSKKTWPVLKCGNIFILPGIPSYFAAKMALIVKYFLEPCCNIRLYSKKIILDMEENNLVDVLSTIVERFPEVKFGCYPYVDHPEYKTIITLEAIDESRVEDAVAELLQPSMIGPDAVLRVENRY